MKVNALKFALAAGIWLAICTSLVTISALLKVPGFIEFANSLAIVYSPYGYSVSVFGILIGAIWGFIEGFVHFGIFAILYNKLVK
jgi:hypothetical protein